MMVRMRTRKMVMMTMMTLAMTVVAEKAGGVQQKRNERDRAIAVADHEERLRSS